MKEFTPLLDPNNPHLKPATQAVPSGTDVDAILLQRGKRYGLFRHHAEVSQKLKKVIAEHLRKYNPDAKLTPSMYEALDMLCHKIGRIANGDPAYADSWIDLAGYAKLVADELEDKDI